MAPLTRKDKASSLRKWKRCSKGAQALVSQGWGCSGEGLRRAKHPPSVRQGARPPRPQASLSTLISQMKKLRRPPQGHTACSGRSRIRTGASGSSRWCRGPQKASTDFCAHQPTQVGGGGKASVTFLVQAPFLYLSDACTHPHTHTSTGAYMHMHAHTCAHRCAHIPTHICMHTHTPNPSPPQPWCSLSTSQNQDHT